MIGLKRLVSGFINEQLSEPSAAKMTSERQQSLRFTEEGPTVSKQLLKLN